MASNEAGCHVYRPPLFTGTNFDYWKDKIKSFFESQQLELWDMVQTQYTEPVDSKDNPIAREKWDAEQKKAYQLHQRARYFLICAISEKEYEKCGKNDTAKEIWDSLALAYEGTSQVQETKANILVRQYELFKMEEDESIETMFGRFQTLVHGLKVLKKSYTTADHVKKILRSLPKQWRPKVTAIQEAKDLNSLRLEDLLSSLRAHELEINEEEPPKKSKSIALKSINKASTFKAQQAEEDSDKELSGESSEETDDELYYISRKIQRMMRKKGRFRKHFQNKDFKESKEKKEIKNQVMCYECKKPGHYKSECPQLIKEKEKHKKHGFKGRKKKNLMATWDDSDLSSSDDDEEHANVALVAETISESEEEEEEVNSELPKLQIAFDELLHDSSILSKEYKSMKKKFCLLQTEYDILKEQNAKLFDENRKLEAKVYDLDSENSIKCNSSKYEPVFQKFLTESVARSKQASMIWGVSQNGRKGIGFKEETPSGHNTKSNETNSPSDHLFCTYCNKYGHSYSTCYALKHKKDKFPSRTNKKGPKKIWVPKDKIIYVADMLSNKVETPIMVPGQWLLTTHDGRKAYVPRAPT